MRFIVLGSGSGGNAAVVEAGGVRLLVDAGLSAKQLVDRMKASGLFSVSVVTPRASSLRSSTGSSGVLCMGVTLRLCWR